MRKYRCTVCGYIHEGDSAPEKCPKCGAPADAFELIEDVEAPRRKFLGGTNSNTYIVFYAAVMVIIVAVILALASLSLSGRQNANILNEKKDAITASMQLPAGTYDSVVSAYAVSPSGERLDNVSADGALQLLFDLGTAFSEGTLPVFQNTESGELVIPLTGAGLWGKIWGYMALEGDMSTVKGVVFDHEGETPGLGAEIATPKFQQAFAGKTVFEAESLVGISVVKGGAREGDPHAVDAISGGTKTSQGLQNMISDCLALYEPFIRSLRNK